MPHESFRLWRCHTGVLDEAAQLLAGHERFPAIEPAIGGFLVVHLAPVGAYLAFVGAVLFQFAVLPRRVKLHRNPVGIAAPDVFQPEALLDGAAGLLGVGAPLPRLAPLIPVVVAHLPFDILGISQDFARQRLPWRGLADLQVDCLVSCAGDFGRAAARYAIVLHEHRVEFPRLAVPRFRLPPVLPVLLPSRPRCITALILMCFIH